MGSERRTVKRSGTAVVALLAVFLGTAAARAADPAPAGPEAAAPAGAAPATVPAAATPPTPDLSLEAIVDEANQEREAALKERERKVAEAEARVGQMKAELEKLIARNEALRSEIARKTEVVEQADQTAVRKLVKVYEAMEPEDAAKILDGVSEKVALTVFSGMKGRAAAGIMGFLPTAKAAHLSERLARAH